MIDQFLKIQGHLSQLAELLAMLPNLIELDVLSRAYVSLAKFNSSNCDVAERRNHIPAGTGDF
jgi:hypothetical protein